MSDMSQHHMYKFRVHANYVNQIQKKISSTFPLLYTVKHQQNYYSTSKTFLFIKNDNFLSIIPYRSTWFKAFTTLILTVTLCDYDCNNSKKIFAFLKIYWKSLSVISYSAFAISFGIMEKFLYWKFFLNFFTWILFVCLLLI